MGKDFKINAAIQLLPIGAKENKYDLIDAAIALIEKSGLSFKVCPFETVVEGSSEKVYGLIRQIQDETLKQNCSELLINIKIHAANRDLAFEEKLEKY
jgi:uncharacterized protein YqgV (UPF0045/DUF77 family)